MTIILIIGCYSWSGWQAVRNSVIMWKWQKNIPQHKQLGANHTEATTNYSQFHHCKTTSWLLNSLRAELYFNHNLQRPSNISGSQTQLWGRGFLRITGLQDGIHWGTRQEYIWKALRGQRTGSNLHRSGGLFLVLTGKTQRLKRRNQESLAIKGECVYRPVVYPKV